MSENNFQLGYCSGCSQYVVNRGDTGCPECGAAVNPHAQGATTRAELQLKDRYEWKTVKGPRRWRPENDGAEIAGFYGGRTVRDGKWGQYTVIIVHVPGRGSLTLSGTKLVQLMDSSMAGVGDPVLIKWVGYKDIGDGRQMKNYELRVAASERTEEGVEAPAH
mgnify:CR=1 FL=1